MHERQTVDARLLEQEAALKRIGELSMENELLRERCRRRVFAVEVLECVVPSAMRVVAFIEDPLIAGKIFVLVGQSQVCRLST